MKRGMDRLPKKDAVAKSRVSMKEANTSETLPS